MSTKKQPTLPTHHIYAITKGKGNKSYWHQAGAAWRHADGKGFRLSLAYLPLNGGELVLREPKFGASDSDASL